MALVTEDLSLAQLLALDLGAAQEYRAKRSMVKLINNNRQRIVDLENSVAPSPHDFEDHSNLFTPSSTGQFAVWNHSLSQWDAQDITQQLPNNATLLTSVDDLDDLHPVATAGYYKWNTTGGNPINAPEASAKHCVMFNLHNADQMHQIVTGGDGAAEPTIWMRRRDGGIWQEWRKVFMANMDTGVLQIPSDYQLHVANTTDVGSGTGGSDAVPFVVGSKGGSHIQMDGNEIAAFLDTSAADLLIQHASASHHVNLCDGGGNVYVGDDSWILNNAYWVRAWRNTTQSVTANTTTTVVFNNETDPGGNHNTGTGIFTAEERGWFRSSGQVTLNNTNASAGSRYLVYVQADTGGGYANWQTLYNSRGTATGNHSVPFNVSLRLLAGQTARVRINSVNHNGTIVAGSNQTFCNFHFIDDYK